MTTDRHLGVNASDLAPLMADLERFLGTGKGSLPEALQPHLGLWQDLALADADGTLLMGADAMHTEPASGHELAAAQPLHLVRTSTKARLELQPFLTARRCLVCQKVETFHYDSTYPRKLMPDFRLLNYERGHAFQIRGGQDQSLLENYTKSHPPEVLDDGEGFDTAVLSDDVARMLEEQNVEKSYLSPAYLRSTIVMSALLTVAIIGLWAGAVYEPTAIVFLSRRAGMALPQAAKMASYGTGLLSIGTILGCIAAPWLAERLGRRLTLALYFVGMMVTIVAAFGRH
ncbi:MAG: hypothetical protein B7X10_06325, partial [Burkholderiales bacterium 21-58-4]